MSETSERTWTGLSQSMKAVLGVMGASAAVVGGLMIAGRAGTAKWERYADKLRRLGHPLTMVEIEARRTPPPAGTCAADALGEHFAEFDRIRPMTPDPCVLGLGSKTDTTDFFLGIPRKCIEPSRKLRAELESLTLALKGLADLPAGRFHIDYEPVPIETWIPHIAPLRWSSKLLFLDGMLQLLDGNPSAAAQDVSLQWHLAGTLNQEPFVISRLAQIGLYSHGAQLLEVLFRSESLENDDLARLTTQIEGLLVADGMKWSLWGERASWVEMCEEVAAGRTTFSALTRPSDPNVHAPSLPTLLPRFVLRGNQLTGTEMISRLVDATGDPRTLIKNATEHAQSISNLSHSRFIVRMMLPNLDRAMVLEVRAKAKLACTRAALAAERFRLAEGRLPIELSELVPRYISVVPRDPFDDQPLRLATTENGIVIYSIGENGVDDGGSVQREKGRKRTLDVVFRLLHSKHRMVALVDDPPSVDD